MRLKDSISMSTLVSNLRFVLVLCLVATLNASSLAQKKATPVAASSSCNRETALEILEQQNAATKTFEDSVQRIAVMIRAADMLWPYRNEEARASFIEAFDLATNDFKEKGDEQRREGVGLVTNPPDQRYTVIKAIAKRDLSWAKKLTDEMLKDSESEADEKASKDARQEARTAEKILSMASSLLPFDKTAALAFAGRSLRYPATLSLPLFLYQLSEVNRAAADQLYRDALSAYANAPMERFLYLSSYPFGNDREAVEMPGYTVYEVPDGFAPNPQLQRLLLQTLLRRVQQQIERPVDVATSSRVSEPGQMWLALTRLEKQIQQSLPDLASAVEQAKGNIFAQLPQNSQSRVGQIISEQNAPKKNFDEQIEAAEKNPNVDRRDQQFVFAIIGASSANEDLERVLSIVDKISDAGVRLQLVNWLYFSRTQRAIKDKQLDVARKLASKVDELDQRGYLYSQIAQESLTQNMDQTQAREMLEEVIAAADKAPATMVTARTLLGVAYLYTKVDMSRAIAVLGEAVKSINRIEQPDFSRQYVMRKIEGKTFGSYAAFQTPGFSPENTFRELGKSDLDGTLYQASQFSNKPLRALTLLALVEPCLQVTQQPEKVKKKVRP